MDKKAFGNFLRNERQRNGKSVEEYAAQLDVNSATITRWEDGVSAPRNTRQYTKIGTVYGLSPEEIFKYTGVSVTKELVGKVINLLPLIKELAKTKLQDLNQENLQYLIQAFCKSGGVDFDSRTIEILIRFKN